jgi:hypothetical protein
VQFPGQFTEASFDPAEIQTMTAAYKLALSLLGLKHRDDPITKLVASKVIEIVTGGADDPEQIGYRVLAELGVPPELL